MGSPRARIPVDWLNQINNFKNAMGIKETTKAISIREKLLMKYLFCDFTGNVSRERGKRKDVITLRFEK